MSHIQMIQEKSDPVRPVKDRQSVSSNWQPVDQRIDGVNIKAVPTLADERGELVECFRPTWGLHPDPLVSVAFITIRTRQIRGWVVHHHQDNRIFVASGAAKLVLYDERGESPTFGLVNEIFLGDNNRAVVCIPKGIYHAYQNIGLGEVIMIHMPNRLYDYTDPDLFRLPLENDLIPYRW